MRIMGCKYFFHSKSFFDIGTAAVFRERGRTAVHGTDGREQLRVKFYSIPFYFVMIRSIKSLESL